MNKLKVPFFDLKPQFLLVEKDIRSALEEVFESQQFILGPQVERLEKTVAEYCGTGYAVGVASGTDALTLSLMALGIGAGDEVIIPPFTFFSTAGAVSRVGAKIVFADIDPRTYNIDPAKIREKVTSRTRAIIPVHLYGQCADMDPILETARKSGIFVVEDAAQALGAEYRVLPESPGRRAGKMGHLGCFSFYPTKNLGAFGDAGMIVTDDPDLAKKIRSLRVHGSQLKYHHKWIGINSRLDTIQAAILLSKFKYLDKWISERQIRARRYTEELRDLALDIPDFRLPEIQYSNRHIFHQYVIFVPERDRLRQFLKDEGIGTEVYYPLPLHLQQCYSSLGHVRGDFPVTESASEHTLALPIYPELTEAQQMYVVDRIRRFYKEVKPYNRGYRN